VSDGPVIRRIDRVECLFEPQPWPFASERRAEIEAHWHMLKAAKPALFNGQVLLMHRWSVEGDVFRGAYLPTDYASFMAFRDFGFPDPGKRNCFSMAALQSADGAFLLGEMGGHTANAGAIYFAAGTPDMKDVVGDRVDLAGSVTRELQEETGLDPTTMTIAPDWTMVAESGRIALMRRMRSPLPAAELVEAVNAFLASEVEPELARVHVIRRVEEIPVNRMPPFQAAYLASALTEAAAEW